MIQILDKNYSNLQPVEPLYNGIAVFDIIHAKLALQHSFVDFVITLKESTGTFKYCYNLKEVEEFYQE